jgi:hypothetical protein
MAGRIWHFNRLPDSRATFSHQGTMTLTEAIACGFQIWWNLRVTSCADAGVAKTAAIAALTNKPVNFFISDLLNQSILNF